MAVAHPQAIGIVAPAAAPERDVTRPAGIGARRPLPHVARHVVDAERRGAAREAPDRADLQEAVARVGSAAGEGAEIGPPPARFLRRGVAPRVAAAVGAAGGELPFRLARQAQAIMRAETGGVAGRDLHHRVVVPADDGALGAVGVTPIGTGAGPPAAGPDIAGANPLRVGEGAGRGDEIGELKVGDLEAHEPEWREMDRAGRLVRLARWIAHGEGAAGDADQLRARASGRRRAGRGDREQEDEQGAAHRMAMAPGGSFRQALSASETRADGASCWKDGRGAQPRRTPARRCRGPTRGGGAGRGERHVAHHSWGDGLGETAFSADCPADRPLRQRARGLPRRCFPQGSRLKPRPSSAAR